MLSLRKIKLRNPLADKSREDRTILAICLATSFVFWLLVKFSKDYSIVQEVNLTYQLPEGKAFAGTPPAKAYANIKSQGWYFLVTGMVGKEYQLVYQVPDRDVFGLNPATVRSDLKTLLNDEEVDIVNLLFDGFTIVLEERLDKQVKLSIPYTFTMQEEYHLADSVRLEPDSVWISGPKSAVSLIQAWPTDSLKLNDLSKTYEGMIPVRTMEEGLSISPQSVKVIVPIERFTERSIFVPVEVVNPIEDSIRLFPDKALVKCVIGLGHYDSLRMEDFRLVADLSKGRLRAGKNSVPLELVEKPDFIYSVLVSPRSTEFFVIKPQ
jgi:hypothetical protein